MCPILSRIGEKAAMKPRLLSVLCAAALVLSGCAGESDVIELRRPRQRVREEQERKGLFEILDAPVNAGKVKIFYEKASDAPRCPKIRVDSGEGRLQTLRPGRKGSVTMVVFWAMHFPAAQWAAQLAGELQRKYERYGLEVIGILEKTKGYQNAPAFLGNKQIRYPIYADKLDALDEMTSAVKADIAEALPSIFIIDANGRIRFYAHGFSLNSQLIEIRGRRLTEEVSENAPAGERIEDYLRRLLKELRASRNGR